MPSSLAVLVSLFGGPGPEDSCYVTSTGLAFGTYDTQDRKHTDSAGDIEIACTKKLQYQIQLDAGTNSGGSFLPRNLAQGADYLEYNLFTKPNRRDIWGDGSGTTQTVSGSGRGPSRPRVHTVYGRIPARQGVGAGAFSDAITVTIQW